MGMLIMWSADSRLYSDGFHQLRSWAEAEGEFLLLLFTFFSFWLFFHCQIFFVSSTKSPADLGLLWIYLGDWSHLEPQKAAVDFWVWQPNQCPFLWIEKKDRYLWCCRSSWPPKPFCSTIFNLLWLSFPSLSFLLTGVDQLNYWTAKPWGTPSLLLSLNVRFLISASWIENWTYLASRTKRPNTSGRWSSEILTSARRKRSDWGESVHPLILSSSLVHHSTTAWSHDLMDAEPAAHWGCLWTPAAIRPTGQLVYQSLVKTNVFISC